MKNSCPPQADRIGLSLPAADDSCATPLSRVSGSKRAIKRKRLLALTAAFAFSITTTLFAATSINATNQYTYGANMGWMNWRGDTNNGAVIGEFVCSGYIYAANVGWINLGSGFPGDRVHYQNNSATDFGVNHDGEGNLRGYAWGANIGWIKFEDSGAPTVDLKTGNLTGHAYSANCGWISLSNAFATVRTDTIPAGFDFDGDGIPDPWELTYTNSVAVFNASTDSDGDGVLDKDEYLADTSPTDPNDNLRILSITRGAPTPTYTILLWTSKATRCYAVQDRHALDLGSSWADYFVAPFLGANNAGFDESDNQHFYRIRAFRPLAP